MRLRGADELGAVTLVTLSSLRSFSNAAKNEHFSSDGPLWIPPSVVSVNQRQQSSLMIRLRQSQPVPKTRSIVLVHVGKSGGMTIMQSLALS
jgi:hypothetical protein